MTNGNLHENVNFDNRDLARYGEGERRMAMRGFEPQYTDIVDYIIRITHKIWEEKAVGYIYDTYQHNCVVHMGNTDIHGREIVVANTIQSLAAYADDRAYAHDVIWTGNEDDGFHTSHLITGVAHNTGWTRYGPPTGRKVVWHTIANCVAKENKIFEEWLLRDEPYVIRQLGYDPYTVAEGQARELLAQHPPHDVIGEIGRAVGQYAPAPYASRSSGSFDIEDFVQQTYHEIWNRRMFNVIAERFATSHECITTGHRKLQGQGELTAFVIGMLAMFPDAGIQIDHLYWNGDDQQGYRVAVRWTFTGTHTGIGMYGSPSNARVRIMGLSQHHVKNGIFHKEFTVFDEMEMLRRIAMRRLTALV